MIDHGNLTDSDHYCLPRVSLGGSVGIFPFLNIYYSHMDGNGKKKYLRFGKKNLSSSKNRRVGRQCQTNFFFFGLVEYWISLSGVQERLSPLTVASPLAGLLCFFGKRISLDLYSFSLCTFCWRDSIDLFLRR